MMIKLNVKAVADEILSLSALRHVVAAGDAPLLTRDSLPGLRVIMRMVFAELMVDLSGLVLSCNLDAEDSDPTLPYDEQSPMTLEVELLGSDGFSSGKALAVKRQMEHIVAAGTLGWVATDADVDFASTLQMHREAALSALKNSLSEGDAPLCRMACDW